MDLDAIIGLSLPAAVIILITVAVSFVRRRRMRQRERESVTGEVYRSPLFLVVTGWVLAGVGLPIGLMGVALQAADEDATPMMVIGAAFAVLGALLVERAGSVFWLTESAVAYKKPFRSGTIPYVDIRDYSWTTSTTGGRHRTAAHVILVRSNGRKTRFNIAIQQHIDFGPLHQWAAANQRRDLLPDDYYDASPPAIGPIPRLY